MRTTIFSVISLSFFILALTSCGGGQSPSPSPDDATVSLYPARVVMAPGEALTFTAVPSDGNGSALSWEASQGTLVANGVTANYTAPNTPGTYEVRVTPNANPAGVATSEITVAMLESETSGTLTSEGGEVAAEDDSIVRIGSGVLSRDAEVRLRAYSGVVREPGEGLVGVGPLREFLFPATAFVNARALPAEAPNGGGGQDDPFDGRILLRVPSPDGLQEDGTYFLEVTIDTGGESFTYPEPYYPGGTGVIEIGTGLLAAIREGLGGWDNVSISTQLVQGDLYLSSAANVPLKGLYAVTDAFTLNSGLAQACPGNANQSLPSGIVRAGAQHLDGRTPLVLITGWQTLANMAAGATSPFSSKTYVPQVCGWSEFLSTMLLENNVFFDDPGELRRQYSIFTFGYDSDLSIATNGLALRNALQTYFGDREIVILAHSMGGLLTNYAVNAGGLNNVAHAITLGTPFRGTSLIHCVKAVDGNCTEVILNPRVKDELDQSCKDSGIPAVVCWASFKDLQQMITGLASRQGDRDLAWQYGGAHNYWVYPLCEGSLRLCAVSIETEPNPRLEQLNYRLNTSSVSQFTAYIGNISPSNPNALFGSIASFLLLADGHASDGIVPVASACLSTGRVDNSCANGLIRTVVPKGLTHTELSGSPNYFDVRQYLLSLLPDTEPPTEQPEEAPSAFALQPAVAFCTPANQPAVRLTWSASSGTAAYEIHRNGSHYADLQTLATTFENTANVTAGATYTYFVRARNTVGTTDSNSRTITVPTDVCASTPTEGADLIVSGLTVTPSTVEAGSQVTVGFSITNQGTTPANASQARIRINTDPSNVTVNDIILDGPLATPALAAGASQAYTRTVTIPASLADGTYYVWAIADINNQGGQTNYDNDRAVRSITIGQPDTGDYTPCTVLSQIITIADPALEAAVRQELGISSRPLTCGDMRELTYLDAYDRGINSLEGLQHATTLMQLYVGLNQVSSVRPLAGITTLTRLEFYENQVSNIEALDGLTNLQYLNFVGNHVNSIQPLAGLINLDSLQFQNNQVVSIDPLAALTNLTHLQFSGNQVSNLQPLTGLTNLWLLDFENNQVASIEPLARLSNLAILRFWGNSVSDIEPLAALTNLEILTFGISEVTSIEALAGLTNLQNLGIFNTQISSIEPLEALTNLTHLQLANSQVSNIQPLAGLVNLIGLYIEGNQISSIEPLSGLPNLEHIQISYNRVSNITSLVSNPGLGAGDLVNLVGNCVDVSPGSLGLSHIMALQNRGVEVRYEPQNGACAP